MPILIADQVRKVYEGGESPVEAVRGVSLALDAGDFVAVMGPSGCGKSTLLHLCGAMDRPTAGRLLIEEADLGRLGDDQQLFLAEAAALAIIGCALGLLFGRLLAFGAVKLTATTVNALYIASARRAAAAKLNACDHRVRHRIAAGLAGVAAGHSISMVDRFIFRWSTSRS